jgi:hypothetical protein
MSLDYEKPNIEKGRLLSLSSSGVMTEEQLLGFLYASWFYMMRFSKDRRGGHSELDHKTGLPVSSNDLLPNHRAIRGRELALDTIFPPRSFILSILRTDEIDENATVSKESAAREWRCLALVSPESWSEEIQTAVEVNTSRMKRLLNQLEGVGLVNCRPMIDDTGQSLGTTHLEKHKEQALGFAPTNKGLDAAEDFVRDHPYFARHLRLEEWLGETMAQQVPQWKQAAEKDEVSA